MNINPDWIDKQNEICSKFRVTHFPSPYDHKLGISIAVVEQKIPIHGLRHHPEGKSTGWFIWAGTGSINEKSDFFQPVHVVHLFEWCPEVLPYLGLPPGWRFLIAPNYVDVWFDQNIYDQK